MNKPKLKEHYTIDDLINIMEALRGENGCPWDKVQTHDSIKKCLIEESYEAIDALDIGNDELFANELGDVLLQVIFHSQIAKERNAFDFDKVLYEVCTKLITRHTHVFGEDAASNADEALKNWDKNKKKESGDASSSQILDEVPHHLPALLRAEKVQKKAVSFGAETHDAKNQAENISKLLSELQESLDDKSMAESVYKEILFKITNLGRTMDICPETALSEETNRFIQKFRANENEKNLKKVEI